MRKVVVFRGPLGAALSIAILGCGDASRRTEVSVPVAWQLDPVPLVELGEADGRPSEVFSRITAVALLGDGGTVVGDGASGTLRVFGPDGTFERQMGGEGQGPGEFAYLGSLHVLTADTVLAYDPVAYRLSTFARSGELLATTQMEAGGGAPEVYLGRDTRGKHLVSLIRPSPRDASHVTSDAMELRRYSSEGESWVSLGVFPGMRRVRSPVPLSPHFIGAVLGDTVFVTDGLLPVLIAIAQSDSSAVTVESGASPWTREEAWARLASNLAGADERDRLEATRDQPAWDSIPRYSDVLPDPAGMLWLKEYDPGTDSHWVLRQRTGGAWTVVSPRGRRIALVAVPEGFRLMAVGHERVAGVSLDSLGVERVLVYRLVRSGPAA
jgi:hypothetical protein